MKIAIGSDHGGFEMKEALKEFLAGQSVQVEDVGCFSKEPVDYPDDGYWKITYSDLKDKLTEI